MKKLLVASLFVAVSLTGCSSRTMYNVHHAPTPQSAKGLSHQEMRDIIIQTVAKRHWTCSSIRYDTLRCTHTARGHSATVDIHYSPERYSITNVGSDRMNQKGDTIHRKYNQWVRNMKKDIDQALKVLPQ